MNKKLKAINTYAFLKFESTSVNVDCVLSWLNHDVKEVQLSVDDYLNYIINNNKLP